MVENLISAAWLLRRVSQDLDACVTFEQIGLFARGIRGSAGGVADDQETRTWVGFA